MPEYVPSKRVTVYYVQVNETNPLGREMGWRNRGPEYDSREDAIEALKRIRAGTSDRTRIKKMETVRGGSYTL